MPIAKVRAFVAVAEFHEAEAERIGNEFFRLTTQAARVDPNPQAGFRS
jgi:hypothetical protein